VNRIDNTFARIRETRCGGLIPFLTAGDPNLELTAALVVALADSGASLIELGVPFSDPVADGPVIQRASERALLNNVGIGCTLRMVGGIRLGSNVPIVLFSYYNPLLQFGIKRLAREGAQAGIDGVLITDLPPEEAEDVQALLAKEDLHLIYLVAPTTTDDRLRTIAERARGFIYAVSRNGVTGMMDQAGKEAEVLVKRLRAVSDLPVAVGFGISNAHQVNDVLRYADAAVVGSAIVAEIEKAGSGDNLVNRVAEFVRSLLTPAERD
jgi:tryptophan synthase alpha chain